MAYIYKITNDVNGKIYIGKTEFTIEKRFKEHCSDSQRETKEHRPLYSAMRKYGIEHFHIEQIEETDNPEEREKYWIEQYNSYHYGYNATLGGDGRHYLDYELIYKTYLETKSVKETAKLCDCCKDMVSIVLSNYHITKEERIKNGDLKKSKEVAMLDKNTNQILRVFRSTHDAGKFLNTGHQHIQEVCSGKRKTAYGYRWKYL